MPKGSCCWFSVGFSNFSSFVWVTTAAHNSSDASLYMHSKWSGFWKSIFAAFRKLFCIGANAFLCSVPQDSLWSKMFFNALFFCFPTLPYTFLSESLRDCTLLWKSGKELLIHWQQWMNWHNLLAVIGSPMLCTPTIFLGSSWKPSMSMIRPHYLTCLVYSTHFFAKRHELCLLQMIKHLLR